MSCLVLDDTRPTKKNESKAEEKKTSNRNMEKNKSVCWFRDIADKIINFWAKVRAKFYHPPIK